MVQRGSSTSFVLFLVRHSADQCRILGAWATYNTIRYFIAFTIYPYHDRQLILLALGTCSTLSLTLLAVSVLIDIFAPHLGWVYRPNAPHAIVQTILIYLSSALLFAPAVVNLAFVFLWRHPLDPINTLVRRCRWDIDVFWSGLGSQCNAARSWAEWLAGSLVRLVLTLAILVRIRYLAFIQRLILGFPLISRLHTI